MTLANQQLPVWVDIVVKLTPALITLVVGSAGVYITSRQYRITRDKLRLDLFAKRHEAFEKLQEYFGFILRDGRAKEEALATLQQAVYKSRFLFGAEIQDYLNELWKKAVDMRTFHIQMYDNQGHSLPFSNERSKACDGHHELVKWHMKEMETIQNRYARYLQFGHVKS